VAKRIPAFRGNASSRVGTAKELSTLEGEDYPQTLRHIPEELSSLLQRCKIYKTMQIFFFCSACWTREVRMGQVLARRKMKYFNYECGICMKIVIRPNKYLKN
jgi:hypothetical protein